MIYLIICQIEYLVKLNKKLITLVKMVNEFKSNGTFNKVGQNKMTYLVKIANGFLVKSNIWCWFIG
jgi:hypothetical protein